MLKHLEFTLKYFNIYTEFFKRGGSFAKTITKKNMSTNGSSFKSQKCSSVKGYGSLDKMIHGEVFISRGLLTTPHKVLNEKNLK